MPTPSHLYAAIENYIIPLMSTTQLPRGMTLVVLTFAILAPRVDAGPAAPAQTQPATASQPSESERQAEELKRLKEQRRQFQNMELITARPFTFIFNPNDPPRIIWRDVDEVRRMGSDGRLRVRWFDAELNETNTPDKPGRWGAYIEGTAPNGTPLRRAMTFYCRPPGFLFYFHRDLTSQPAHQPGPIAPEVWAEHQDEISRVWSNQLLRAVNDTEAGVILIAGLSEAEPLGRAPLATETAAVRNDDYHLALKLKVLGLEDKVRPLQPPRKRAGAPAPKLHEGPPSEAGARPDAKARIDRLCAEWAEDSGEPFVTLVARNGVIITHRAFGRDKTTGEPIGLDYRCDVASITKSVTAILFSQFVDQRLIDLDDSVGTIFPDYPRDSTHVPTFRQCFTHTSGLTGHGDWGGVRNPHLDNIILNGIDANEPGKVYAYSGMGFDLAAEAMELVTGKSFVRLYHEHLFKPLEMGDVPMDNASAGAKFTAWQLGVLAQWVANRGSYGDLEFISPATFERMLPEDLNRRYPGIHASEGIGMHWIKHRRPDAPNDSGRPEDQIFSPRTVGHGSLFSCIFLIDLDRGLVITQVRRGAGPRFGEWSRRFFETIVDGLEP